MKKTFAVLLLGILLFYAQNLFAQKDTLKNDKDTLGNKKDSVNRKNDSLNTAILLRYNRKLNEIDQFRIADSIKRAGLEEQINSLKSDDSARKGELQKQLDDLKNRRRSVLPKRKSKLILFVSPQRLTQCWDFSMIPYFIFIINQEAFPPKNELLQ